MPIYEFLCARCDHAFEELFRARDPERRVRCPECGSLRVEKQWSAFGFTVSGGASACSSGGCAGGCGGDCGGCGGSCRCGR
jgi:putative FmdB family regulatory protein